MVFIMIIKFFGICTIIFIICGSKNICLQNLMKIKGVRKFNQNVLLLQKFRIRRTSLSALLNSTNFQLNILFRVDMSLEATK